MQNAPAITQSMLFKQIVVFIFWTLTVNIAFASADTKESYVLYNQFGQGTKPSAPLPKSYSILLEKQFGPDITNRLSSQYEKHNNSFRRTNNQIRNSVREAQKTKVSIKKCNMVFNLGGGGGGSDNSATDDTLARAFTDAIINFPFQRKHSFSALSEMENRQYLQKGEMQDYLDDASQYPQTVALSTITNIRGDDFRKIFPDKIDWSRVIEIKGEKGLDERSLTRLVENGSPEIEIMMRRATLRVISNFRIDHTANGISRSADRLPWENIPEFQRLAEDYSPSEVLKFEIGRAAQLPGTTGEAFDMARLSAIIMLERISLFARPGTILDSRSVGVYMHTKKPANSRLYSQALNADIIAEVGQKENNSYQAILRVSLAKLIIHTKAWETNETIHQILKYTYGNKPTYDMQQIQTAMSHLIYIRWRLRSPYAVEVGREVLTPTAPIVIRAIDRDYHAQNIYPDDWIKQHNLHPDLRNTFKNLDALDYRQDSFGGVRDEGFGVDHKQIPSIKYLFSGFNIRVAQADPQYVLKFILTFARSYQVDPTHSIKNAGMITANAHIIQQAEHLGLTRVAQLKEGSVFAIKPEDMQRLIEQNPEVMKAVLASPDQPYLSGHHYNAWMYSILPGI